MKRSSRTRAIHEAKSRRRRHGPREFVTCCNWPDAQNLGVGGTYAGAVHVSWETITCATSSLLRCLDSDSFTSAAQFVVVTYSQSVKSASRYEIVTLPDGFLFPALHPTACTILLLLLLHFVLHHDGSGTMRWTDYKCCCSAGGSNQRTNHSLRGLSDDESARNGPTGMIA